MNINTIKHLLQHPGRIVPMLGAKELLNWMPDKLYLSVLFKQALGYKINWENPRTFNEKLQWLKVYERKPLYTQLVDKYAVREYIAEKIGEEYLIPLVGGPWNSVDEIDFDSLPEQFVLKTTHDSGGVYICRDKREFDFAAAKAEITKRLSKNYYWGNREWPYKNVKSRIIAEKYMQDGENKALLDLKFFCFNGEPEIMYMGRDRAENSTTDFFDMDFNLLDMRMKDPNSDCPPEKPDAFEQMRELARTLSAGIPHVRVDFYYINNKIYSGELTFYHNGGFTKIYPRQWEKTLGDWIKLPEKNV